MIDTLDKWRKREAWAVSEREDWFTTYPLRGMFRLHDGRYQFGYEIAGYGTVVGHCCRHSHRSQEAAEDCGRRFLAGKPPRWWWRLHMATYQRQGLTNDRERQNGSGLRLQPVPEPWSQRGAV